MFVIPRFVFSVPCLSSRDSAPLHSLCSVHSSPSRLYPMVNIDIRSDTSCKLLGDHRDFSCHLASSDMLPAARAVCSARASDSRQAPSCTLPPPTHNLLVKFTTAWPTRQRERRLVQSTCQHSPQFSSARGCPQKAKTGAPQPLTRARKDFTCTSP